MNKIKIESVARPGTEEYLLMLLASDACGLSEGEITVEAVESYLDRNPDEGQYFDQDIILRAKRRIQAIEELALDEHVKRFPDRDIRQKLRA